MDDVQQKQIIEAVENAITAINAFVNENNIEKTDEINHAIFWCFIRSWSGITSPFLYLLDLDDVLFPGKENTIINSRIPEEVITALKQRASSILEAAEVGDLSLMPAVSAHLESVVKGDLPYGFVAEDKN